jgi:hypothetical protein
LLPVCQLRQLLITAIGFLNSFSHGSLSVSAPADQMYHQAKRVRRRRPRNTCSRAVRFTKQTPGSNYAG